MTDTAPRKTLSKAADRFAKRAAALKDNIGRRKASLEPENIAAEALPGLLPDHEIRRLAQEMGMIEPFVEKQTRDGVISYGLSSFGYDARAADEFKIFTNIDNALVDPKNFSAQSFVDRKTDICVIPPNSFVLTRSVEYFRIPEDVLVICLGKSTYARCGLIVNVTPLEPGWEGHVTLEISNTTPLPARVYANEGVAQFLFFKGSSACEVSYADRKGKYMGQKGVTLPRL
jgi:dCTP deaminase